MIMDNWMEGHTELDDVSHLIPHHDSPYGDPVGKWLSHSQDIRMTIGIECPVRPQVTRPTQPTL